VRSDRYPELIDGIKLAEWQILKLFYLVAMVLDPVRNRFGAVAVTSSYRPPMLNRLVGGVPDSQHLLCEAADFVVPSADPFQVYVYITTELRWAGELIWYKPEHRFHVALPRLGVKSDYIIKEPALVPV